MDTLGRAPPGERPRPRRPAGTAFGHPGARGERGRRRGAGRGAPRAAGPDARLDRHRQPLLRALRAGGHLSLGRPPTARGSSTRHRRAWVSSSTDWATGSARPRSRSATRWPRSASPTSRSRRPTGRPRRPRPPTRAPEHLESTRRISASRSPGPRADPGAPGARRRGPAGRPRWPRLPSAMAVQWKSKLVPSAAGDRAEARSSSNALTTPLGARPARAANRRISGRSWPGPAR